eukprot:TRINITY_DN2317_c0_g1_i3.p1 TRINITY_DN2317_c0_g1~~TRINITY_DN2317_c0_g1_i3.p1  ORF type:complete len:629 (+),score=81.41 TRINITY_DN2317_c0_g1_i3:150-2036(+)
MGRGKVVSVVSAPVVEEASKRAVPQFLQKTYEMVESPTTNKHVTWTSRGRSFVILNKQGFEKTILPRYFKHSQFTSFVRQLNMYGFSKSGEKDWWEFSHPNFLRGREDMLLRIHRKLSAAQGAEGATKHDVLKLREDKERIMDELYEVKTSTSELTNHVSEVMKLNETLRNDLAAANNKVASLESTLGNVIKFLSQVHTAQPGSVSPDSVAPVGLTFDSSNDVDESISRALKRRRLADGGSFGVDCETDPEAVKALSVASGLGSYFGYDIPNSPSAAVPELKLDPNDFASTERSSEGKAEESELAPMVKGERLDVYLGTGDVGVGAGVGGSDWVGNGTLSPRELDVDVNGAERNMVEGDVTMTAFLSCPRGETKMGGSVDPIAEIREMLISARDLSRGHVLSSALSPRSPSPVSFLGMPRGLLSCFSAEELRVISTGNSVVIEHERACEVVASIEPVLSQIVCSLGQEEDVAQTPGMLAPEAMHATAALAVMNCGATALTQGLTAVCLLAERMRNSSQPITTSPTTTTTTTTATTSTPTDSAGPAPQSIDGESETAPPRAVSPHKYRDGLQFNYKTRPMLPSVPALIMAQQTLIAMGVTLNAARHLAVQNLANIPVSPLHGSASPPAL